MAFSHPSSYKVYALSQQAECACASTISHHTTLMLLQTVTLSSSQKNYHVFCLLTLTACATCVYELFAQLYHQSRHLQKPWLQLALYLFRSWLEISRKQ